MKSDTPRDPDGATLTGGPGLSNPAGALHDAPFRPLFADNPLPMWIYDLETLQFLEVNAAAVKGYGYTRERFLEMRITDIRPPEDVFRLMSNVRQRRRDLESSGEWRHRLADGRVIDVEIDSHTLDFGGHPAALVVAHDVSARKETERALRASEERYRDLIENANDIIYVHDLTGRLLSVNRAAERLTGYRREEVPNLSIADFLTPESLTLARKMMLAKVAGADEETRYEVEVIAKDGRIIPLEVATRLVVQEGKPVAVEGIARDITDRRRTEERMRDETARAAALADISQALSEAGRDYHAVLDTVAHRASDLIGDLCLITMLSRDGGSLTLEALAHPDPEVDALARAMYEAAPQHPDDPIIHDLIREGRPLLIPEIAPEDARAMLKPQFQPFVDGVGILGILAVPLRVKRGVAGVLGLARTRPGRPYTEENLAFVQELAERAALAIANAMLFEETERRFKQVQSLHRIEVAISASLNLGATLGVILDQVVEQLKVDAASVLLLDAATETLVFAAGRGFRSEDITRMRIPLGSGAAGKAALTGRTVALEDLSRAEDFARRPFLREEGFVTYYAIPLSAKGRVRGVLDILHRSSVQPDIEWLGFLDALAGQAAVAIDNAELFHEQQRLNAELTIAYDTTLEGWSRALDLRDKETEGHSKRVAEMTERLARALGVRAGALVHVRRGALLHDIGKMGVPDSVLLNPGRLTDAERGLMREHPVHAFRLLSPIPYLREALAIPYCHHERWDGTGYPRGLEGADIPFAARLFAVVDVWDALRSDRPYRPAWPEAKVRAHIASQAGAHFDPAVVETFLTMGW
jgi:PAS domain S-box-containing protein/putative nucleotidyltransferase with HDIG domain